MRRPNGRCSLSGSVWPSPDSTSSHLQFSDGVRFQQRQLLGEALATTPFRRQERDFLPQRLRPEIDRLPLPENERPEGRIGKAWNGKTYPSLSKVAFAITGTRWSGP